MKKLVTIILLAGLVTLTLPDTASAAPRGPRSGVRIGFEVALPGVHIRSYPPIRRACHPYRIWVEGRYEWRTRERHVPGRWVVVREAPVYRTVTGYSGVRRVVVSDGGLRRVWEPPRTELVRVRVWIPGHWRTVMP
jgi:hypothetical protein